MTPRGRSTSITTGLPTLSRTISAIITATVLIVAPALSRAVHAGETPTFAVDPSWPKPLPNNWILGQVGGITVDAKGPHLGDPPPPLAHRR